MKPQACFNLGRKEKKKRVFAGILTFAIASAVSVYLVFYEIAPLFRAAVFPLFFISVLCFLQAKEKTCILFAARKERVLDEGREVIADRELNRLLWLKSQKILLQSLLIALALSFLCAIS